MKITPQIYAAALYQSLEQVSDQDTDTVLDNFAKLLAASGHLDFLDDIEESFLRYEQEQKGKKTVAVTFADPEQSTSKIMSEINKILGKNTVLSQQVDKGLIGGVVIETEDELIDASLRTSIKKLKDELSS